jgi:hypothetical protein
MILGERAGDEQPAVAAKRRQLLRFELLIPGAVQSRIQGGHRTFLSKFRRSPAGDISPTTVRNRLGIDPVPRSDECESSRVCGMPSRVSVVVDNHDDGLTRQAHALLHHGYARMGCH